MHDSFQKYLLKKCENVSSQSIITLRRQRTISTSFESRVVEDRKTYSREKKKSTKKKLEMEMFASASSNSSHDTVDSHLTVKEDIYAKDLLSFKEHLKIKLKETLKKVRSKPGANSESNSAMWT